MTSLRSCDGWIHLRGHKKVHITPRGVIDAHMISCHEVDRAWFHPRKTICTEALVRRA